MLGCLTIFLYCVNFVENRFVRSKDSADLLTLHIVEMQAWRTSLKEGVLVSSTIFIPAVKTRLQNNFLHPTSSFGLIELDYCSIFITGINEK